MSIADKLQTIAENEQRVYEAGKAHGETVGKKAQYDEFWDKYQQKGNVYSAQYMFANEGWNNSTFKPKYSQLVMNNAANMFNTCAVTDLKTALEKQGVVFDFKRCTSLSQCFGYSSITVLPEINATGTTASNALANTFTSCTSLHTITKLILKNDGTQTFTDTFKLCNVLENLTIEGVIGKAIDIHWSTKLSKASITSVINALSATTSGLTATFSKTAVETAFGSTTSQEWLALRGTKSNWTISLV